MRRRSGAVVAACVLATCAVVAQAPAPALTPGQVLLLANTPDPTSADVLKRALVSDDPHVRLVAGRVMAVEPEVASVEALTGALAREQDPQTGAELVRDVLLTGNADAVAAADRQAHRLGPGALLAFAEWQARMQPAELASRLKSLAAVAGTDQDLARVVVLAIRQHREEQNHLLREWMSVAADNSWRTALDALDSPDAAAGGDDILKEALRSDRAGVRLPTVWFVLGQVARKEQVSSDVLDVAAVPGPSDSSPWEAFGRELLARRHGRNTPDRTELIENDGAHQAAFLSIARRVGTLSSSEEKAARAVPSGFSASQSWQPASARTVPAAVSGVIADVLQAASCHVKSPTFGGVAVTYAPSGRPLRLEVASAGLSAECAAALTALSRTTVADVRDPVSPTFRQWLLLPFDHAFASCPADTGWKPPKAPVQNSVIQPPRLVTRVKPVYPGSAQAARISGVVLIAATISETGCVSSARVAKSIPMLDFPALVAVTQWRYTPTTLNGQPVPVSMTVTVDFTLR